MAFYDGSHCYAAYSWIFMLVLSVQQTVALYIVMLLDTGEVLCSHWRCLVMPSRYGSQFQSLTSYWIHVYKCSKWLRVRWSVKLPMDWSVLFHALKFHPFIHLSSSFWKVIDYKTEFGTRYGSHDFTERFSCCGEIKIKPCFSSLQKTGGSGEDRGGHVWLWDPGKRINTDIWGISGPLECHLTGSSWSSQLCQQMMKLSDWSIYISSYKSPNPSISSR